jgi:primase-polymerase (primpol)-like protein
MTICLKPECGIELPANIGRGRKSRYCSNAHKQWAYRNRHTAPELPQQMTQRKTWTRRDGKRPIQVSGYAASSTNPGTWASFEAVQSGAGNGYGIMLGMGLGCYDLDHCLDGDEIQPWVREFIASISEPVVWVERSMSGDGLHVFVETRELVGYRRGCVEFYPRSRFIAVTGDRFII